MSDAYTPRLALPTLAAGQAQKEVSVNEAFLRLDALVQPTAVSASLSSPPACPPEGVCWIVAAGATGAWAGQDDAIAQWTAGGWRYLIPQNGWRCTIIDAEIEMTFLDGAWQAGAIRSDGVYIAGKKIVGPRMADVGAPTGGAVIDGESRTSINTILTILRTHGLIGS